MQLLSLVLLLFAIPVVLTAPNCRPVPPPNYCRDWHIGLDRVNPRGTVVHGHANFPVHQSPANKLSGTLHGSHVFGGPHNGAQTVGGGLNYQHSNGLHGGLDATHTRGVGNTFSGTVGGSTRVGPGTLTVGGGANTLPGSSKVQGQVGATYTVPLH